MSMSSVGNYEPTVIATCDVHNQGDGRQCPDGVDSENYSTDTVVQNAAVW